MKKSLWIRIKLLFGWKPKPPLESLREMFNRVRFPFHAQPTRTKEEMEKLKSDTLKVEATGDYNLRFNLQNMTESIWLPVRENEIEQSRKE